MDTTNLMLLDLLRDGVILIAPSGAVIAANRSARDLIGQSGPEFTLPPAVAARVREVLAGRLSLPARCDLPEGSGEPDYQCDLVAAGDGSLAAVLRDARPERRQAAMMKDIFAMIDRELRIPLVGLGKAAGALSAIAAGSRSGEDGGAEMLGAAISLIELYNAPRVSVQLGKILKLAELYGAESLPTDERFDLAEIVDDSIKTAALELAPRGVTIAREGATQGLGVVYGNRRWMHHALAECLWAMAERVKGRGEVLVHARHEGTGAILTLGLRLPHGNRDTLPAFVPQDGEEPAGGLGVGLSIAARALTLHGGRCSSRWTPSGFQVVAEIPTGGRNPSDEAMGTQLAQCYARDIAALVARRHGQQHAPEAAGRTA